MQNNAFFLSFLFFSIYISLENDFSNYIVLNDFTKTNFTLDNEFVIFQYQNNYNYSFQYEINFIFDKGYKSSTKVLFYDSFKKIERDDTGFINYVEATTLKETREIKISYNDNFYHNQTTYYIVLYDISNTYTDSVYTLNSLDYLPFNGYFFYHNSLNHELHFNFLIQEKNSKYFHIQVRPESGNFFNVPSSYLRLTNEKGEKFIEQKITGASLYVKIEPSIKYYFEITSYKKEIYDERDIMLSFEKYRKNILLEKGVETKNDILVDQHLSYFKNISELSINETIFFKFHILSTEDHKEYFFIKYYESDNFEKLETSFPSKKEDFDKEIGSLSNGGIFKYELKKKYKSQKGVLFGVFIERGWDYYSIKPTSIYASVYDKEEESEPEPDKGQKKTSNNPDENKKDDENTTDAGKIIGIIFSVIAEISIFCCCVYCCVNGKCPCSNHSYNSNSLNDDNDSEYDIAIIAVKKKH